MKIITDVDRMAGYAEDYRRMYTGLRGDWESLYREDRYNRLVSEKPRSYITFNAIVDSGLAEPMICDECEQETSIAISFQFETILCRGCARKVGELAARL